MKKALILGGVLVVIILVVMWSQDDSTTGPVSEVQLSEENTDYSANFTFEQGNYGVYFPMPPMYSEGAMALKDGRSIPTYIYQYTAEDQSIWQSMFTEYPEDYDLSNTEELLLNSVDIVAASLGGEVTSVESVTYQGYPAMDYLISVQGGVGYFKGRHVLNGNKFYALNYAYDAGYEVPSAHFFDSLVLN